MLDVDDTIWADSEKMKKSLRRKPTMHLYARTRQKISETEMTAATWKIEPEGYYSTSKESGAHVVTEAKQHRRIVAGS